MSVTRNTHSFAILALVICSMGASPNIGLRGGDIVHDVRDVETMLVREDAVVTVSVSFARL